MGKALVLKDVDFIITHKGRCEYLRNKYKCDIEIFGIHNYLFDQKELLKDGIIDKDEALMIVWGW